MPDVRARLILAFILIDLLGGLITWALAQGQDPTPSDDGLQVPASATPIGNYVAVEARLAYVRSGPGRDYATLGQLKPGQLVVPISRDTSGDWILILYRDEAQGFDGFAWIGRNLVRWVNRSALDRLPVLEDDALTPSATFSMTPEPSATFTPSPTATYTASATATNTPTATYTASATATHTPTATYTASATATHTPTATYTASATATHTPTATYTASASPPSPLPQRARGETPTATSMATVTPSETATATATATYTATATSTVTPSETPAVLPLPTTPAPTLTSVGDPEQPTGPRAELGLALTILALVVLYVLAYWRSNALSMRFRSGFLSEVCPVCQTGHLHVENRPERFLGLPDTRHTVRCSQCRSVLREVRPRVWRYAVDPTANPALYTQLNNRELSEVALLSVLKPTQPQFIEDDAPQL